MPRRLSVPFLVLLTVLLTGVASCPAGADSLLTLKSHTDAIQLKDEMQPAKDTEVRLWVGADRVRRDEGDTSMILRLDRNKLFLLHHPDKTYNEIALPADFLHLMPHDQEAMATGWAQQMKLTVRLTPGTETKKINAWTAKREQMDIASAMGMKIATTLWVSKEIAPYALLNRLTATLANLQPGAADWSQKLEHLDGFPVLKEDNVDALGAHFKTREELISVETRDAPAGAWEPPAGYTAAPFNPLAGTGG